jgi:MFS family permease
VETDLWASRMFVVANVVSFLYGMALYPWILVGVLYTTDVWHYDELQAGLANTPGALAASVAAVVLGRLTGRYGPRLPAVFGLLAVVACGVWLSFGLPDEAAFLTLWLPAGLVGGAAMGAITVGTSSAAALSAPPTRFAGAFGMNTMARQFGGALGVAVLAVILDVSGSHGVDAYAHGYLFCTMLVVVAFVVAAFGLRIVKRPRHAAVRARAGATPVRLSLLAQRRHDLNFQQRARPEQV